DKYQEITHLSRYPVHDKYLLVGGGIFKLCIPTSLLTRKIYRLHEDL
ncbi:33421_t:CDS:1, partial [Racocetra persica]